MDADLRAIQRKRLAAHRCAKCGTASGIATLCGACGRDWRYCSMCERVYPRAEASRQNPPQHTSIVCKPCDNRRRHTPTMPRAQWMMTRAAARHERLAAIRKMQRKGLTNAEIAAKLNLSERALSVFLWRQRRQGVAI